MSNPTPILNNINAFDATKGTTISFNIIGGTDIVRSNIVYIYDLSTNDLICTHLYISTESIHELPPNTDSSIVYADGKSSADFVNNKNYYLQIQTFTNTAGTAGGSGMSVAKTFWCLFNPALSVNAIPAAISTTSYNVGATYTTNITDVTIPVTNIIQQYKFDLYTATGTLVQTSGNIIGSGEQEGTSTTYNITYNFSGLVVNNSYYVVVTTTSTEGMTVSAQSNTFTVSIDTPTVGGAIVNNNACDGYISVVSNLSGEYGGHVSGEVASFETDSVNNVSSLKVDMEPIQEGSGTPSPTNIRPIRGHSGVNAYVSPTQSADDGTKYSQEFDVSLTPTSTDKVPYTFKAVGRDVYGDRESDKIVGGTVAWNQLASTLDSTHWEPATASTTNLQYSNGVVSFLATVQYAGITLSNEYRPESIKNHKYLFSVSAKAGSSAELQARSFGGYGDINFTASTSWTTATKIFNLPEDGLSPSNRAILLRDKRTSGWNTVEFKDVMLIDLTALFNPTIADYIYSLEQANAGTGVAWFRNYFPKDYYPYDKGTLRSVEGVSAHETVGKNLIDSILTQGSSSTVIFGQESTTDFGIGLKAGTYTISVQASKNVNFYMKKPTDSGNTHIGNYSVKNATFTLESDADIRIWAYVEGGLSVSDISTVQLEFGSTATEYEPYTLHTYPLDSSLTLRGIPKLVDGKLAFDGDVYPPSGEVQRRYGVVDLGTLEWTAFPNQNNLFYVNLPTKKSGSQNCISKYPITNAATWEAMPDKSLVANVNNSYIYIKDTSYTDAAAFKAAMSGVYLVYELATPTTETADPYQEVQICSPYGTEEYVTTGIVPVGHNTTYLTRDIFGGTLDLVTGVLTVDRAMVTLDGVTVGKKFSGTFGATNNGYAVYWNDDIPRDSNAISDRFVASISDFYNMPLGSFVGGSGAIGTWTFILPSSITSKDEANAWLAENPTTIVYKLVTPQTYQLTPHQIQTLVGQNNVWSDAGDVEVTFNLPISNLLVKRQDASDVSGDWLTLYSQPITQASDMDFTYIDFLNQHGKTYRYALVPLLTQQQGGVDVEIEGGYTVSDDVLSVFDGVFVANSNGSQKLKAATEYGDLETNQDVGVLTTIGNKYPFVVSNSNLNYHSGSISALIVPSDFYTNGDLDRLDIVERREAIEQFLTDKTAKILKDWNGNIWLITFVENVEVSFVDDYGMGLGTLSAKWVEIGDVNDQTDLKQTGLI